MAITIYITYHCTESW